MGVDWKPYHQLGEQNDPDLLVTKQRIELHPSHVGIKHGVMELPKV
jgi:hypothetical protein